MRDYEVFEKMEVILQNRVVSEYDLHLFKFAFDKKLEKKIRKIYETKTYEYKIDFNETRFILLFHTINELLKVCATPFLSIVIESEEKNNSPKNKPAVNLYLNDIMWLQVFGYLFLKNKALHNCVSKHWYRLIHSSAVNEYAVPFMREDKNSWYILPVEKMGNQWDLVIMSEQPTQERIRKYFFKGNLALIRHEKQLFYIINANTDPYLDRVMVDEETITTFDTVVKSRNMHKNQIIRLNSIEKLSIALILKIEYKDDRTPTVSEFRQSLEDKFRSPGKNEAVGQILVFDSQERILEFIGNRKYHFASKKINQLSKFETFLAILFGVWLLTYTVFKRELENFIDGPLPSWGGNLILVPIGMFFVVSYFKNRLIDSSLNDHALNSSLNKYARNELIYSFFPEINRSRNNLPVCDLKFEKTLGFKKD